jgi:thymidylate synthase ThyX
MTISAWIIADSISAEGIRITSVQLRYPKFIHGELMTHRVFSRNAASSRAIPVERMIKDVMDDPAMPVYWGKNQKGMSAEEEMTAPRIKLLKRKWLRGRDDAVDLATTLMQDGLHKQIANRVLEPWFHINTLVTATEWDNFFDLRLHKDAQPEMRELAERITEQLETNQPDLLKADQWHTPYAHVSDTMTQQQAIWASVARCARVSYLTQEGFAPTLEQDLALYERLVVAKPIHASPAEHQACPDRLLDMNGKKEWQNKHLWRNFKGWRQYRAFLDA